MIFSPCIDLTPAEWIATNPEYWWNLVTLGPTGFPAYGRLRFIPDPAYEGQSEHEGAQQNGPLPDDALSESEQLHLAVQTLLQHSGSPSEGYLLMWDGWGEDQFPDSVLRAPRVVIPNRAYYLCSVSLLDFLSGAVEESWEAETGRTMPLPAFVWPSDRAWCITSDVDPHWAGIGAGQALIDSLLTEPRLDVVRVEIDQKLPFYQ
ncbi:hypothetical protein E8P82_13435 [Arthrobacter echini]|uniref:Uncharacterized protein n=1 Tax=Arthrobacter echini TaxID=1529066 RepID=A0A4S5E113_9MICC|nr:hypothetical protein [Arthrobacter echini]THJ64983.1 hypothetical protein E8P82_13435 [Arthrobacter echini]